MPAGPNKFVVDIYSDGSAMADLKKNFPEIVKEWEFITRKKLNHKHYCRLYNNYRRELRDIYTEFGTITLPENMGNLYFVGGKYIKFYDEDPEKKKKAIDKYYKQDGYTYYHKMLASSFHVWCSSYYEFFQIHQKFKDGIDKNLKAGKYTQYRKIDSSWELRRSKYYKSVI